MARRCSSKLVALTVAVLLFGALGACSDDSEPTAAEGPPRAWIDHPRDGVTIPLGATVVVVSHANAVDGVTEVLLSVDGVALSRDPPAAVGESLVEVRQQWVPQEPGLHTLEVRAYTAAGAATGADAITVRVEGEMPATATTALTTTLPATTPPATTPPATTLPVTTSTSIGTTLPATTSTTTVPPSPPPQTTAPDTVPPPMPTLVVPADELVLSCRTLQTLAWLPVVDPSGVTYEVALERQLTATEWELVREWSGVADKQVQAEVDCGVVYRWTVRARDGLGNTSSWAPFFTFAVELG